MQEPFNRFFRLITTTIKITKCKSVLDVGTKHHHRGGVTGFRQAFTEIGWEYLGIDIESGLGVDLIVSPYNYPFRNDTFDVVMASMTLEHVEKPWLWFPELKRVCKIGGAIAINVPWKFKPHLEHDFWRVLPMGLKSIFEELGLAEINIFRDKKYTFGIGRKK